jgi:hypothetical protein
MHFFLCVPTVMILLVVHGLILIDSHGLTGLSFEISAERSMLWLAKGSWEARKL